MMPMKQKGSNGCACMEASSTRLLASSEMIYKRRNGPFMIVIARNAVSEAQAYRISVHILDFSSLVGELVADSTDSWLILCISSTVMCLP